MKDSSGFPFSAIDDDREEFDGHLDQLFRAMRRIRVKEKGISHFHLINLITVPISDPAFDNVDQLLASVLEQGEDVRVVCKRDEIRLNDRSFTYGMPE